MKQCSKCGEDKFLENFRNDKYGRFGKISKCKECLATFTPKEIRCFFCLTWFTQKQSNYKFCSPRCHMKYWNKIDSLSNRRYFYMREYWKKYVKRGIGV
jgi:hypothetical protein